MPDTTPDRRAYTVPETAKALGVSEKTIRRAIASRGLPAVHVGPRRVVIPVAALEKWLEESAA